MDKEIKTVTTMAVYKRGFGNQKCYHSGINCINMESILLPEKMNILYRIAKQDFYAEYIEFLLYIIDILIKQV